MSTRLYYLCELQLDGRRAFFLWFSDDQDGVEQGASKTILTFPNRATAQAWANEHGASLSSDSPAWYDFESIAAWCDRPTAEGIDSVNFLNAWNLLSDLRPESTSIFRAADRRGTPIYDKLFFGSNLPSVTPSGQAYRPSWSDSEVTELARVLRLGLAELRGRLPAVSNREHR